MLCRLLIFALCILWQGAVEAKTFLFPVPLILDEQSLGEVNVYTDGRKIESVSTIDLINVLDGIVDEETLAKLQKTESLSLTTGKLREFGVVLTFEPTELIIKLELDSSSYKRQDIPYNQPYQNLRYSKSAFFAWHNIFNVVDDYTIFDDSEQNNFRAEWISSGNIGGAKWLNFEFSGFYSINSEEFVSDLPELYRGDARIFIDWPDVPFRGSMGDLVSIPKGHQPSITFGGIAVERLWSSLQPTRNIQSGSTQTIILNETASVAVFVNDIFLGDIRLPPGRYNIDDLPLTQGANEIRFNITYQSGRTETLYYSQFYNDRLLKQGFDDFGFYAGVISQVEDRKYSYDTEQYVFQSFYDYGFTDNITAGVNSAYHPLGYIAGLTTVLGTSIGNFSLRNSFLGYEDQEEFGYINSLDYSNSLFSGLDNGSVNLRLAGEAFTDYRATPWREGEALRTGYRVVGNYRYNFLENLDFNVRASWEENQDATDLDASVDFNWYPGDFRFTVGAEYNYTDDIVTFDETNYFFSVTWNWFSETGNYSARVDYQSLLNVGRVTIAKNNRNTPGSFGFEANADIGEDIQVYSLRTDYTANRYAGEVEYSYLTNTASDAQTQNISTRLSTAISVFDTDVAWSRSYFGPAAMVKVHDSLDADVYINEYYEEEPQSIATQSLNNTAPLYTSHNETRVLVTVPDAPVGYNYGNDVRVLVPGTYTGHIIEVGSSENRTVIGTLLDEQEQPIILRNGYVLHNGGRSTIFTNSAGRFALDGVGDGEFEVHIVGDPSYVGRFSIEKGARSLIYLNELILEKIR